MSGKRKRKFKRKRKNKEKRMPGGVPLAEIHLSLRSNLDSLFVTIKTLGAPGTPAPRAARDYLAVHLSDAIDRLGYLAFQKKNTVAARWAAQTLSALFYRCINPLIGIASTEQGTIGKQWAGKVLARVYVAIEKRAEALGRVNSAFRKTKAKIGKPRRDIVVAPRPIGQIVQKELATAERYRGELFFYRRLLGKNWESLIRNQSLIRTPIPREYWPTLELKDFSKRSEPVWWKFLWPLFRKKIDMSKMRPLKQRDQDTVGGIKDRKRYLSDLQKACRDHLRALARQRDAGLL